MTLMTPSPSPASASTWPIMRCVCGQTSDDLRMTVLPQASGMATARTPRITGAFQGAMPYTTPTGWRCAMARLPGTSEGTTSPETCVVMEAASRNIDAAKCTLKWPQPAVEPVSPGTGSLRRPGRESRLSGRNGGHGVFGGGRRGLRYDTATDRIAPFESRATLGRSFLATDQQLHVVHEKSPVVGK